ncbi:MAG TPA: RsmE family RNA methyltransferase, partial [SAR324 cluster bacterium]|nr:RsmE family RNA methyltransferase [SAR324 cluster bacterium]
HQLLIGPEGGWHQDEINTAENMGWKRVGLGPRIMRSETAALSALSILQYLYGDMGRHSQKS